MEQESLLSIFQAAGVKLSPNGGCAACCGGPKGTWGRVEQPIKVVSTTNRNFPGRMGHLEAEIYLASPYTAASAALTGQLVDPKNQLKEAI